jgi:hypothetical protein
MCHDLLNFLLYVVVGALFFIYAPLVLVLILGLGILLLTWWCSENTLSSLFNLWKKSQEESDDS